MIPPPSPDPDSTPQADPGAMLRDWITLWQSELAGLATDREAGEHWVKIAQLWADQAGQIVGLMAGAAAAHEPPRQPFPAARPAAAARSAPADAAPAAGDAAGPGGAAELEQLRQRVGELERRLAGLGG